MDGVLNRTTRTVHKHESDYPSTRTACGATFHLHRDQLEVTTVERALDDASARKCGRCFEDGGGY
jgi:hypothetical protein